MKVLGVKAYLVQFETERRDFYFFFLSRRRYVLPTYCVSLTYLKGGKGSESEVKKNKKKNPTLILMNSCSFTQWFAYIGPHWLAATIETLIHGKKQWHADGE